MKKKLAILRNQIRLVREGSHKRGVRVDRLRAFFL